MKILLIAGHGAGDPGAVSTVDGVKYKEGDETRKLVALLAAELGKYEVDVQTYDTTRNAFVDYRAGTLALPAADYVLEVHFNAIAAEPGDGKTKGVECYVTTTEKGTAVEEAICKAIAALGFRNRGVKRTNFAVISRAKAAGASAALLETCFLDDADDMRLYTKSREKVAQVVTGAIAAGFGLKKKEAKPATIYRVQVGAFADRKNAEKMLAELKAKGYNPFITKA